MKYRCFPFIATLFICFLAEILVTQIPQDAIAENSRRSALYYKESGLHPQKNENAIQTRKDYYADTILLNLISKQDNMSPLRSVILSPYFDDASMNAYEDYMAVVFLRAEANVYYFRYWHGSMVWLKPLLCVMDVTGIFALYKILTIGFLIFIMIWSVVQKKWKAGVSFMLAFLLSGGWETVSCLEYGNTMLLILVMMVLYLVLGKMREEKLLCLCIINGAIACFIDFLTIETLAFSLPMGFLFLTEQYQEGNGDEKKHFFTFVKSLCCWGFSYAGMFLIKWVMAARILGIQGLWDSIQRTGEHMSMQQGKALFYNIRTLLYATGAPDKVQMLLVTCYGVLLLWIIFCLWKNRQYSGIILVLIPYMRYMIVSNHSYTHHYFTYRAQMISIMLIIYVLLMKITNLKFGGRANG